MSFAHLQGHIEKIRAASDIGKKGHKKFHHPLFNPFLSVLHQNKALHNFHKMGQDPIARCINSLDKVRPIFFVFYRKDLVLLNLISRCITFTSEYFLNIVDLCIVNLCVRKVFSQCNTARCCVHITRDVNIYLYMYVSKLVPVCLLCV